MSVNKKKILGAHMANDPLVCHLGPSCYGGCGWGVECGQWVVMVVIRGWWITKGGGWLSNGWWW